MWSFGEGWLVDIVRAVLGQVLPSCWRLWKVYGFFWWSTGVAVPLWQMSQCVCVRETETDRNSRKWLIIVTFFRFIMKPWWEKLDWRATMVYVINGLYCNLNCVLGTNYKKNLTLTLIKSIVINYQTKNHGHSTVLNGCGAFTTCFITALGHSLILSSPI